MRTILEYCEPSREVLQEAPKDEVFATRLQDVIEYKAEPLYQDPIIFKVDSVALSSEEHVSS